MGIGATLNLSLSAAVASDTDVAGALIKEGEHADNDEGYALIALSTHGRGGLERWAMGSSAERILHGTKLPLLIVRPQVKAATKEAAETQMGNALKSKSPAWVGLCSREMNTGLSKRNVVSLASSTLAELAIPTVGRSARATGGSVVLLQVTTPAIHYGYGSPLMPLSPAIVDETVRNELAEAAHSLERVAAASHFAGGGTRSGSFVWVGGGDHPFSG